MTTFYQSEIGDVIVERDGKRYLIRTKNQQGQLLREPPKVYVERLSRWGGKMWQRVPPGRAAEIAS